MSGEAKDHTENKTFLLLEETSIPGEILRIAENELNESQEKRAKCLLKLKMMILREKDLESRKDDEFLLRFLRAKKFDCDQAFKLLKKYYTHRYKYPGLFLDFKPSSVVHVLDANIFSFLTYRNETGCAIWLSRLGMWDPRVCTFEEMLSCGLMCMEKEIESVITQICGIVIILDLTGFSLSHLWNLTAGRIYCFMTAVQDSFPARHKEIHIINHPSIFSVMFSIIKPLLTEKIRKRVMFHGSNPESLHRYFPPSILPEEFGGELGPFDNSRFAKVLLESEQTFVDNQRFGYKVNKL